jgi:hypothetical protein
MENQLYGVIQLNMTQELRSKAIVYIFKTIDWVAVLDNLEMGD